LFSEEQAAIQELPQETDLFDDAGEPVEYDRHCTWETWEKDMIRYDPADRGLGEFFAYASCHWVEHFGAISTENHLPGLAASVERLCQADSTRLHNWIKQNCRPDCTIQPRFPFDGNLYDPLSITSLYGSQAMLRYMVKNSDLRKGEFIPESAMRAADQILHWGDLERLKILLDGTGNQLRQLDFFRLIMRRWFYSGPYQRNWEPAFLLVHRVTDTLVEEKWGNELLCLAANLGCMPMIRELMSNARLDLELRNELLRGDQREQQLLPIGKSVHQSIGEAVLGNHIDVVEFLLEEEGIEAHLQHINSRGENVLHRAAKMHNPAVFRLLVPRFSGGVHQRDKRGDTPLTQLIKTPSPWDDRYECARVLLSQGRGDGDGYPGDEEQSSLRVAVRVGDYFMCHLLLTIGKMDPLSALVVGEDGQMVLKDECTSESKTRILAFLRQHAERRRPNSNLRRRELRNYRH
jgi:ankyrin repeat protein